MKYNIGKIAKALGITTQSVRHYESVGIIETERDETSKYRTYTMTDIKVLFQTCIYRSMGFSLKEIMKMVRKDNVDDLNQRFDSRIKSVDAQIEELMSLKEELIQIKNDFKRVSSGINQVEIIKGSLSAYLVLNEGHSHDIPGDMDAFLIECIQNAPHIRLAFCIKTNTIFAKDEEVDFRYGALMDYQYVQSHYSSVNFDKHHIVLNNMYARIIVRVTDSEGYSANLKYFIEEVRKMGYEPSDYVYGICHFVSLNEEETEVYEYYVEVMKRNDQALK